MIHAQTKNGSHNTSQAEIRTVEHLCNLYNVPDDGFLFDAAPPKFKGVGTFPVRAYVHVKGRAIDC